MAEIEEESRAIRQADYDAYFKDLMDSEGLNVDEAAEQVIESISSQYDVHNLFMYKNKRELDEKMKVESRCVTIEKAGKGTDSFINANFAFQGLVKILKDSDASVREGIWHMFESRKLLRSLIQLMVVKEEAEDDNKKVLGEVDSDSDEEDEDEANILQTLAVLDFSMAIVQSAKSSRQYFHDFELFFTLDETLVEILRRRLDEDIADPRVVAKMVEFLFCLLALPQNKQFFLAASGVAVLDLSLKMQKKNSVLVGRIRELLATLV